MTKNKNDFCQLSFLFLFFLRSFSILVTWSCRLKNLDIVKTFNMFLSLISGSESCDYGLQIAKTQSPLSQNI